jgi:hypothetical protein
MKTKKIYILLAIATMMASCSHDVVEKSVFKVDEVSATLPELEDGNVMTRSSLIYDSNDKKMHFTWESGDTIGVFAVNDVSGRRQQVPFILTNGAGTIAGGFETSDESMRTIEKDKKYIAFRPYSTKEDDYAKLDLTYKNQVAKAFPKMKYFQFSGNTNKNIEKYQESEKDASAHLTNTDYMVSDPTIALQDGHCAFEFARIGAVVRFYLKSPNNIIYDGLQLVAKGKQFVMTGMFNAENKKIIPLITNNTMNLTFSPTLDLRKEDSDYYYKGAGYIVTYMMVAPIDLRDAEEISIYLKGHDGVGNSHYYKSKGKLEKPNLTANMFYQWTSADNSDNAAIIFDKITVQDWEKDVIYDNGEEGTGTGNW